MNQENKNWQLRYFCEFDKYAEISYCAIHGVDKSLNLGDITKIDEKNIDDFSFMTFGSPCQDYSLSGNQKGAKWTCQECGYEYNPLVVHYTARNKCPVCGSVKLEKTRSSLLVEAMRILHEKKPIFGLFENVKNLVGSQFKETFDMFVNELQEYGYNTYYKVLNAKDFKVPQSRERLYLIFIKKDIDNGLFKFPTGFKNDVKLEDILLDEVPRNFYISEEQMKRFITELNSKDALLFDPMQVKREGRSREYNDYCPTLAARDYKDPRLINATELNKRRIVKLGNVNPSGKGMNGNVFSSEGLDPTLTTNKGEGNKILTSKLEVRKLVPQEQFRLMGFPDEAYFAVKDIVSASQLYKQTGNSIVVDVLYYIFLELYKAMPYLFDDLTLGSFFSGIGAPEMALNRLYEAIETENFTRP